ncbi:hypothetical protein BH10ACT1_BH10ACT1_36080 [soil metagenome]
MSRPLRILVTDSGRASALAGIRSFGRAGHVVVAADSTPNPAGARSRYTTHRGHYPSAFDGPTEATAEAIGALARRHSVDVVVPITDDTILPLVLHQPALPAGCVLAVAPRHALDLAASKVTTSRLAGMLGIDQPEMLLLEGPDDAAGVVERLGSPVVVKPDRSRVVGPDGRLRKGSVSYARTDAEVADAVIRADQPVLAQAYRTGVGHGIGLVAHEGKSLVAVAHRRLHEVPVSGGASARRETVAPDPAMLAAATDLLQAMQWTGAAMVEFKVGPEGAALMEVNGRIWGSLPLAVRAGADVPRLMLAAHLDDPEVCSAPLDVDFPTGVVARNLDLELVWIGSVLARGRTTSNLGTVTRRDGLVAAGDLLRRGQGDDLAARDDLRPVLTGVRQALGHAARKVGSRG